MVRAFAATLVLMAACADPPVDSPTGPANAVPTGVPDVAKIVCEADGSTTIRTPEVVVQPDGVHVHVVSRLDEPASINGFGFDVGQGDTAHVSGRAPGVIETACWPFSQHGSGAEPPTSPVQVLDPEGLFVDGEIDCSGTASSMIADYFDAPKDAGPVPLEAARERIVGLLPHDELVFTGYPEQPDRAVAVRRDGEVVANFSFVTFDGERWSIVGANICSSSELRHR